MHATEFATAPTLSTPRAGGVDLQHYELPSFDLTHYDLPHFELTHARASDDEVSAWSTSAVQHALLTSIPLIAGDILAVMASFAVAWRLTAIFWPEAIVDWKALFVGLASALMVSGLAIGLYPGIGLSRIAEARKASIASTAVALVFLVVSTLQLIPSHATQFVIAVTCCLLIVCTPFVRGMVRAVCTRFTWWGQPALIVGGAAASITYDYLQRHATIGLRPVGIIGDWPHIDRGGPPPAHHLGPLARAGSFARRFGDPWFVVAMPREPRERVNAVALGLDRYAPHRVVISRLDGSSGVWDRASACLDWPGHAAETLANPALLLAKRVIDVTLTVLGGLALLPLMLSIAAAIKWTSPGPVIFRQERVGRGGKRFLCWKFRTMLCDNERVLHDYLEAHPECREAWERDHKLADDPRVTTIGRLIRKTSLDELPQLWNVLKGEMSLVGPRPILAREIADFGADFEAFRSVQPGITGLWQVSGRNHTTYAEHIELDTFYARHWSLWLDLYILAKTIKVVLFRHGAY